MKKLKKIARLGFIAHNDRTGEEWLVCKNWETWIYLGVGRGSNWVRDSYNEDLEFPDGDVGGYYINARDAETPIDECDGWENDFEILDNRYRYLHTYG